MRTHKETYNINANKETIFNVIANIENYPTFLPWCIGARITDKNHLSDIVIQRAELVIAFKSFRESFFSDIHNFFSEIHIFSGGFRTGFRRWPS